MLHDNVNYYAYSYGDCQICIFMYLLGVHNDTNANELAIQFNAYNYSGNVCSPNEMQCISNTIYMIGDFFLFFRSASTI